MIPISNQHNRDVEHVDVIENFEFFCTGVRLEYIRENEVMKIDRVKFQVPELESGRVTFKIRNRYEREFEDEDGFISTEQVEERYPRRNKPELLISVKNALKSEYAVKITAKVTELTNMDGDTYHLIRKYHMDSITVEACSDEKIEELKLLHENEDDTQ